MNSTQNFAHIFVFIYLFVSRKLLNNLSTPSKSSAPDLPKLNNNLSLSHCLVLFFSHMVFKIALYQMFLHCLTSKPKTLHSARKVVYMWAKMLYIWNLFLIIYSLPEGNLHQSRALSLGLRISITCHRWGPL